MTSGYAPDIDTVMATKNSYVLAHELGHASGFLNKYPLPLNITQPLTRGAMLIRAAQGADAGYNRTVGISKEEEDSKALKGLVLASQIASVLQLAEEGQASLRGLKAIYDLQGANGALRAAKLLGPAY